jgi:hypothetical protein
MAGWKQNGKESQRFSPRLRRNDSVKKNFNHRWTQINTDEEMSERRSGPDFRRSLNDALYAVLEYHVFYPCPSVNVRVIYLNKIIAPFTNDCKHYLCFFDFLFTARLPPRPTKSRFLALITNPCVMVYCPPCLAVLLAAYPRAETARLPLVQSPSHAQAFLP